MSRERTRVHREEPSRNIGQWKSELANLTARSLQYRVMAYSRREFYVGSAILMRIPRVGFHISGGGNFKPKTGPRREGVDYCAEMRCLQIAEEWDATEIIGIVTTAPSQPDDVSGRDFGVTVSCYFCRQLFRRELLRNRSPLRPHTRLRFVDVDDPSRQVEWSVEEFLKLFRKDPPSRR